MDSLQSQAGAQEWQHPFLLLLGRWGQLEDQHCSHCEHPRVGEGDAWIPQRQLRMPLSAWLAASLPCAETWHHSSHPLRCQGVPLAKAGDLLGPQPAGEAAGASLHARCASRNYYMYNLNAVTSCAEGIKY